MGLPTFFRWISERYPKCVSDAIKPELHTNLIAANPNEEVDNLYIDINDILHISFHPDDAKKPESFEKCMSNLTYQIEELVRIARPREMIYIAFDGVAPKAKLNLQRKRRFEKYKNSQLTKTRLSRLQQYRKEASLPECDPPKKSWNSNCLSPGSQFMFDAANYLSNWIQSKQLQDSFWTGLHVILSDSFTPGEGEHKIMQHIRRMRTQPGYNPNTRHVVCGRDADLILLALATHEPHFRVLRQVCHYGKMLKCPMCFRHGHCRDCVYPPAELPERPEHDYIFFDLNIFRQCFAQDVFQVEEDINIENILNDFILITFFLGNDFLPKIPGLSIRSGALELLIETYKTHLMINKEYLTNEKGDPVPLALRDYLMIIAHREPDLITQEFRINRRCIKALKKKGNLYTKHKLGKFDKEEGASEGAESPNDSNVPDCGVSDVSKAQKHESEKETAEDHGEEVNEDESEGAMDVPLMTPAMIRAFLCRLDDLFPLATFENTSIPWFNGLTLEQMLRYLDLTMYVVPPNMRDSNLKIPFGMHWKRTYYNARFSIKLPKSVAKSKSYVQNGEIRKVLNEYMRGLLWCWKYYTCENPDWEWFYPHHYGPCLSDLSRCILKDVHFPENSKPLDPLVYLMSLLPCSDSQFVPPTFRPLIDAESSPIRDFYPKKVVVDYSEAYVFWQGIVQLPFIDFDRMKDVTDPLIATLPAEYQHLNRTTKPRVFVASVMDLGSSLLKHYGDGENSLLVEGFDLQSVNPIGEATGPSLTLGENDEFSICCKEVIPIKGFVPMRSSDSSFKSLVAYIKPLEKESFSMHLLPGVKIGVPDILENGAGIGMVNNYRRFGTLRKIWYKAIFDKRTRMAKEKKVLGYFSPEPDEQSMFEKKDPARSSNRHSNKGDPIYNRGGSQPYNNPYSSGNRNGRRNQNYGDRNMGGGASSQIEHLLGAMVQQKLAQMMSQPNPNVAELVNMMKNYISLQMSARSASSNRNPGPQMQSMMQQMQLLNMMQNALATQNQPPMTTQQMMNHGMQNHGGMQNHSGPMPGMQSNPMMKNFGPGFNQMNMPNAHHMNMPNTPMMSGGMNSPMANMMSNQNFNQIGGPHPAMRPTPPAPMMQQNGMVGSSMGGSGMGAGAGPGPGLGSQADINSSMQQMMATLYQQQQQQQEVNQRGEGEMHEPGATTPHESTVDTSMFNQSFPNVTPNNVGFNSIAATPPPPPQQSGFSFSNYQSVMKQVHTPDGTTGGFNSPSLPGTPQFSPQTPSFNFPPMNSFQNTGFNQTPRGSQPYGGPGSNRTSVTPTPGMNQNMWPPMGPTTPTAGGFPNPLSQFLQPGGGSPNRNFNNKINHFNRNNYGMSNY